MVLLLLAPSPRSATSSSTWSPISRALTRRRVRDASSTAPRNGLCRGPRSRGTPTAGGVAAVAGSSTRRLSQPPHRDSRGRRDGRDGRDGRADADRRGPWRRIQGHRPTAPRPVETRLVAPAGVAVGDAGPDLSAERPAASDHRDGPVERSPTRRGASGTHHDPGTGRPCPVRQAALEELRMTDRLWPGNLVNPAGA